ncbi:MAG: asparagine synthase (glutamine-hydrolyzing) [Halioglobus sp.]|jgi:asparagine synthase (glutamine-hydrolysing)
MKHLHSLAGCLRPASLNSSGSTYEFGEGCLAAIAGAPRWLDTHPPHPKEDISDAAALATAYQRHGVKCLDFISGPFSFAIIDQPNNSVLAGIDRLGLHTLYYSQQEEQLIFGSSAKSVIEQSNTVHTLSQQGLYDYFYFHMVPSPQTVYQGVGKLPAAHYLEFKGGKLRTVRYWSPSFARKASQSFTAMGSELKDQLRCAVKRSAEGRGKVGTFLSGGLDSSTVTGMLAELRDSECPAYAIGFDEKGYDEMEFARNTAKHFGVKLHEYYVTPQDVVDELPTIATSYQEPFGNSSALPAYFCAKRAMEDGVDCLLAGDGGDEIFAGNGRYAKQKLFGLYSYLPEVMRRGLVEPLVNSIPSSVSVAAKLQSYIEQAKIPLPDRLQSYNYLNRISPTEIFDTNFLSRVDVLSPLQLQRETFAALPQASDLSRMLYLDWQYTLADNDIKKVSQMCAVAGVDVTYPMLDEDLVAFACQVPDHWKLKRKSLRHFYKESLSDWLPQATLNKKKQGFGLPFGLWMQSYKPLREMACDSIVRLKSRGYFNVKFLDRLLKLHETEHAPYYGELIWILTVFDLWLEGRSDIQA